MKIVVTRKGFLRLYYPLLEIASDSYDWLVGHGIIKTFDMKRLTIQRNNKWAHN